MIEVLSAEIFQTVQTATVTMLAIVSVVSGIWIAVGRSIWKRISNWFEHLDAKLDGINKKQIAVEGKVEQVIQEQKDVRAELITFRADHNDLANNHHALAIEVARLQGRAEMQTEAAQMVNAAANVANAITHPKPEETYG